MVLLTKRIFLVVFTIFLLFSCKVKDPSLKDYSDYYNAIFNGDIDSVKKHLKKYPSLIAWEFNFAGVQSDGLITAALGNHFNVFELLLKKGTNPNYYADDGVSPIMVIIEHQRIEMLNEILKYDVDLQKTTENGNSVLHYVAIYGNNEISDILLPYYTDVDPKNSMRITPLAYALSEYRNEISLLFISAGANLEYALSVMPHIIPEYVMNNNSGMLDLFWKRNLIDPYAEYEGFNLFHYAVWQNNIEFVKELVKRGLWDFSKTPDGETPLQVAERLGHQDIVDIVQNAGLAVEKN